ncbi:MAG: VWA domain-containing protein, partial [Acidobacteria bacterium]
MSISMSTMTTSSPIPKCGIGMLPPDCSITLLRALADVVALLILAGPAWAQFTSGVNLVAVYVTVTAPDGMTVTDLLEGDFEVREDGVRQTVSIFTASDFPLAVALAFDHSASMAGRRLELARKAAASFLGALRPADRAMTIGVANEVEVLTPLSTDRAAAVAALAAIEPWSTTRLHDAVIRSIDLIEPAGGRRALVLLSDGADRGSTATAADALDRARRADVLIYPVALGATLPPLFPSLAVLTGGRSFQIEDPKKIEPALTSIADELRTQYLLGY